MSLFGGKPLSDITLEEIASRAGVSVQTVIRRFGSRDKVIEALADVVEEYATTNRPVTGHLTTKIDAVVQEYERFGPTILRGLAQESDVPVLRPLMERGRVLHREWIAEAFHEHLRKRRGAAKQRLLAGLVIALDVYAWKVLRIDLSLDEKKTKQVMQLLVEALLRKG